MINPDDIVWPEGTRQSQKEHSIKHVQSINFALTLCTRKRTVIQAGGNIGLWPIRMAECFDRVITFEPEPISHSCLVQNTLYISNIEVRNEALGIVLGKGGISRKSLGSHKMIDGDYVNIIPIDHLDLSDVDLIQLDVEGYELLILKGALETIRRSHPIIQVELRDFTEQYAGSNEELIGLLKSEGYVEAGKVPGSDVVFKHE